MVKDSVASGKNCSRRDFLKRAGFTLAGTALASQAAIAVNPLPRLRSPQDAFRRGQAWQSTQKIRIGVVGGGFGVEFQWHEHPDCIVEAVSDLRDDRRKGLMKVYNCQKAYNCLEELVLDKNVDAAAIFTDGPLHVQHTIEAMKNGKHVVRCRVGCAHQICNGVLSTPYMYYMMAETGYYQQSTISARKFYEQGKFGALYYCEAEYQHPGLETLYFHNDKRTWRYGVRHWRRAVASSVMHSMAYASEGI